MEHANELLVYLIENSDKIGVGVLAIVFSITALFALRYFFKFTQGNVTKDKSIIDLAQTAISTGGSMDSVIEKMEGLLDLSKDSQLEFIRAQTESGVALKALFDGLLRQIQESHAGTISSLTNVIETTTRSQFDVLHPVIKRTSERTLIGVLVSSVSGRILAVNKDFSDTMGFESSWFFGKTLDEVSETMKFTDFRGNRLSGTHFLSLLSSKFDYRYREIVGACKKDCSETLWFSTTVYPIVTEDKEETDMFYVYFRQIGGFDFFSGGQ